MRRVTSRPKPCERVRLVHLAQRRGLRARAVPNAVEAREVRRRFGRRDDVVRRDGEVGVRQRDVSHRRAELRAACRAPRRTVRANARVERRREVFPRAADRPRPSASRVAQRSVVVDRRRQRSSSRTDRARRWRRDRCAASSTRRAEYADLIERRRERDEAVPAHATVRRLDANDAAERRRLPYRSRPSPSRARRARCRPRRRPPIRRTSRPAHASGRADFASARTR